MLLFDELDSIGTACGCRNSEDYVMNQLLTEIVCVGMKKNVFVIGATNRPELLRTCCRWQSWMPVKDCQDDDKVDWSAFQRLARMASTRMCLQGLWSNECTPALIQGWWVRTTYHQTQRRQC